MWTNSCFFMVVLWPLGKEQAKGAKNWKFSYEMMTDVLASGRMSSCLLKTLGQGWAGPRPSIIVPYQPNEVFALQFIRSYPTFLIFFFFYLPPPQKKVGNRKLKLSRLQLKLLKTRRSQQCRKRVKGTERAYNPILAWSNKKMSSIRRKTFKFSFLPQKRQFRGIISLSSGQWAILGGDNIDADRLSLPTLSINC